MSPCLIRIRLDRNYSQDMKRAFNSEIKTEKNSRIMKGKYTVNGLYESPKGGRKEGLPGEMRQEGEVIGEVKNLLS